MNIFAYTHPTPVDSGYPQYVSINTADGDSDVIVSVRGKGNATGPGATVTVAVPRKDWDRWMHPTITVDIGHALDMLKTSPELAEAMSKLVNGAPLDAAIARADQWEARALRAEAELANVTARLATLVPESPLGGFDVCG